MNSFSSRPLEVQLSISMMFWIQREEERGNDHIKKCINASVYFEVILKNNHFIFLGWIVLNSELRIISSLPKKTVYGKCPRCKTKSALEVVSGNPGKEKFKCNQCYYKFGMEEL